MVQSYNIHNQTNFIKNTQLTKTKSGIEHNIKLVWAVSATEAVYSEDEDKHEEN